MLRKWFWMVPSEQPPPVVVVAVNTLETLATAVGHGDLLECLLVPAGGLAMISPLETVTTPLASVLAALANGTAITAASATREITEMMNLRIVPFGLRQSTVIA